ncbi:hypothetical protein CPB83DRAFT_158119 [Crepidotus variabilis]|uniref:Nephrocystin 3-like N-terminal domain-containing protein n=1 Tax=Crepidotus variabilis TaxID=179855 RepID=A0A9P6EKF8_9AGAR|nr:hypothetical protein CPB83DRAFT_158119 [Crepidotus variabilis]
MKALSFVCVRLPYLLSRRKHNIYAICKDIHRVNSLNQNCQRFFQWHRRPCRQLHPRLAGTLCDRRHDKQKTYRLPYYNHFRRFLSYTMSSNDPPTPHSITFFDNGSNVHINESNFVVGNNNTIITNKSVMTWFDLLLSHCARDALVDSKERYNPPKCAPQTREAIQKEIVDWINTLALSGLVLWLKGSAGSGKSAIAQTIAEQFNIEKTPSASFFFSRISGSPTRVDGDRLLPTIIYQLCLVLPEYRKAVMDKLTQDPTLFQRSRGAQMSALFTKPLQQFSFRRALRDIRGGRSAPLLIIVDGLDECRDPQVQCDILRVIADAAASIRRRPVRFLIACRPEAHITRTFDQHPNFQQVGLRRINLDDDQDASMAILTFLRQEFAKIRRNHPLHHHLDPSWPNQDVVELLVSKSSPQFILASTAMLYVASPKHRPMERLEIIIDILSTPTSPASDQPLQRMDSLYTFIFGGIIEDYRDSLQSILGILHLSSLKEYSLPPPTPTFVEKLLSLKPGEVQLCLEPLSSVIHSPQDPQHPIKSLHASLFDFLLNPARSRGLALNLAYAQAALIGYYFLEEPRRALPLIEDPAVQTFSLMPMILQEIFVTLLSMEFPPNSTDKNPIKTTQSYFKLVEISLQILEAYYSRQPSGINSDDLITRTFRLDSARVLRTHSGSLVSFRSPILRIKHVLYTSGCCGYNGQDRQKVMDAFRDAEEDRSALLHLTLASIKSCTYDRENELRILDFIETGEKLQALNWPTQSREMQELGRVIKSQMLQWIGDHQSPEANKLRTIWMNITFYSVPLSF